jgi:VanZ family protein
MEKAGIVDRAGASDSKSWGWVFAALWCGLILLASSIPDITTPRGVFAPDKAIHLAEYAILSAFLGAGLSERVSWPVWVRVLVVLGMCAVFGAADETYQHRVAGRSSDVLDFAADLTGALVGLTILTLGRVRRGRA